MDRDLNKAPRLYVPQDLKKEAALDLGTDQAHYLKNVLRLKSGAALRLFNGRDGEWLAVFEDTGRKSARAVLQHRIRTQETAGRDIRLLFAPIKKQRMDFLIEKAVELGVSALHPVLTARTEVRSVNAERVRRQIIGACEQCERLDIPVLHAPENLAHKIAGWKSPPPIHACIERGDYPPLAGNIPLQGSLVFLTGPEGGFTAEETAFLRKQNNIRPVSLGKTVLRAETASLYCLSLARPD